jgi:hypothetical protein
MTINERHKAPMMTPFVMIWSCLLLVAVDAKHSKLRRRRANQEKIDIRQYPTLNEFVLDLDSLAVEDRLLGNSLSMNYNLNQVSTLGDNINLRGQTGESCTDETKAPGNACSRVAAAQTRSKEIIDSNYNDLKKNPPRHVTNGDEEKYGPSSEFPFIGSFSKTLPHDANGLVDVDAYETLVNDCIAKVNADCVFASTWNE